MFFSWHDLDSHKHEMDKEDTATRNAVVILVFYIHNNEVIMMELPSLVNSVYGISIGTNTRLTNNNFFKQYNYIFFSNMHRQTLVNKLNRKVDHNIFLCNVKQQK